MKKKWSYTEQVKYDNIILGALLALLGCLCLIPKPIGLALEAIGAILHILLLVKLVTAKREKPDEMAQQNIDRAKSRAMDYMALVMTVFAAIGIIVFSFVDLPVRLTSFITSSTLIWVGCSRLLIGLLYLKYEEE